MYMIPSFFFTSQPTFFLKIINFIRNNALQHRQFKELLKEAEAVYDDLVYFTNARWLSQGNALHRFSNLLEEIKKFLSENKKLEEYPQLSDVFWIGELFFFTDLTAILNDLNLKLQGRLKMIPDLADKVKEFIDKLKAIKANIQEKDFQDFPIFKTFIDKTNFKFKSIKYIVRINNLINAFEKRFKDFYKYDLVFQLLRNPTNVQQKDMNKLSQLLNVNKQSLQNDLNDIEAALFSSFQRTNTENIWSQLLLEKKFRVLQNVIPNYLSMFGSTYLCESTFSHMNLRKNKFRSKLTQKNLEAELRITLSDFKPDFIITVKNKKCH